MPEYDFKTLSPADFELLVRDLLTAQYGWRLEAFGHGKDGGVDLRGWVDGKKIVVQCKHYAGSTFSDLCASARKELLKMDKERPDRYLFATSQNLSRTQKDSLAKDLSPWLARPDDVLTQLDLNEMLGRHPKVERQHFKLWLASTGMLELIVRSGLWARSEALLEDVRDRVKLYVRSPGYERAFARLDQNHVVVLTGTPGVGKSMLAEMLLLAHWHEGWQVVSVSSNIDEAWETYRPSQHQIFFYDDFLGQTDISERGSKNEDARIVRFMDRVSADPTKRLVMTTRSQILRQTALVREPIARGNFHLRECVVELADYGPVERAQILYNHLYFSELPRQVLRDYIAGEHYWKVVDHPNFSPRVIEQVIKRGSPTAETLARSLVTTLARPIELWGTMFATVLSDVAQRVVLTLVTFPVDGVSPDTLRQATRRDAKPIDFTNALKALEGTFIKIDTLPRSTEKRVTYANPSVRDFVLAILDDEPEYGLALVSAAQSIREILTLLQYADARSEDKNKFPRLAAAMAANQKVITDRIDALIAEALEASAAHEHPKWQIRETVIRPLAATLDPASRLMPGTSPRLLARALELSKEFDTGYPEADILENLTWAFIVYWGSRLDNVHTQVHDLVCDWGASLSTTEDVEDFIKFTEKHDSSLNPYLDLTSLLKQYAEGALRSEIDAISSNRTDVDTDSQWLDSIEGLAERIGIVDRLQGDIEYERASISEHYEEMPPYDPTLSRDLGYSTAPSQSLVETRLYIGGIFRQLS
ncbi:restriction endonuclease [Sphaerisporangium sp. NPDC088356]|uniref:nSTAND3 domain-containing NTPase n=1 Tax=Sphaerisporangium sp. NPDC088356 TaxID=3154871 RepID=UPI003429F7A8